MTMSSNPRTSKCSDCLKFLPLSLFIRKQSNNTFYKTCSTCRTQRNIRRQNLRRQRSVAPSPPVVSTNSWSTILSFICILISYTDDGPAGNENMGNVIDPQIIDIEMETNSRVTENTDLNFNLNNPAINLDFICCTKCKRNRTSNLFRGRIHSKIYKTCSDCRSRENNKRRPQAYRATINVESHLPSIDVDSVMKYCTMCKKNCSSTLFTSNSRTSPYTTCSDCRSLERTRRLPNIFPTRTTQLNVVNPL
ncbi:hypothetical protein EPUL_006251, partial [Erysiphe pulchra]